MDKLICKFRKSITSVVALNPNQFLTQRVLSYKNNISEGDLKTILETKFPGAKEIQVKDVSGGCGAMFNVYVEAKEFNGLTVMKQHKAIYDALDAQIKQIHGLHIVTKIVK